MLYVYVYLGIGILFAGAGIYQEKTTTSAWRDPVFLIQEYFNSSANIQFSQREIISKFINTLELFLEVLNQGASGKFKNCYEAAINLLAEIENPKLFESIVVYSGRIFEKYSRNISHAELIFEILITSLACAYRIDAQRRLNLILGININRRSIKASIIDALILMEDEFSDNQIIKSYIETYCSDDDPYIRECADEALSNM